VNWDGVSVLVTGESGFTGSALARRLVSQGAVVVAPLRSHEADDGVERTAFELTDSHAVERVLNEHGVSFVFHLAARTIAGAAGSDPFAAFEVNVRGTYAVLDAVRSARSSGLDTRAVVASTYHVYGEQFGGGGPLAEDAPLRPVKPYDASKACADLVARSYADTYSMPVAVTRLANVYGGGDREESRLVAAAARALVAGERPVIRSDGTPERDFVYIDDAVDAYLAVAESLDSDAQWGRAWNAGAGEPVAIADVVRRLARAADLDVEPDIQGTPNGAPDRQYLDASRIRAELGWEPRWALDDGLAATYRWYAGDGTRSD
jgi:CDP-glucose 4,6-dehydratase